jgi:hypothetical protein
VAKARVAKAFHGFSCTGEGGYPERFIPYADHMIGISSVFRPISPSNSQRKSSRF